MGMLWEMVKGWMKGSEGGGRKKREQQPTWSRSVRAARCLQVVDDGRAVQAAHALVEHRLTEAVGDMRDIFTNDKVHFDADETITLKPWQYYVLSKP